MPHEDLLLSSSNFAYLPPVLTRNGSPANMQGMAHSFLIFDFGSDEDAAQRARHQIDAWKQGFRLDKKLQVKFERKEKEAKPVEPAAAPAKDVKSGAKGKGKSGGKSKSAEAPAAGKAPAEGNSADIRLIVRLDFSDHEKLSHQRWIERIPAEDLFKAAKPQIIRAGQPDFKSTSDLFDSLD